MENKIVIQSVAKNLLLLLLIALSSCRVAKKDWVKVTFAEKQELTKLEQSQSYSTEKLKSEISESLILEFSAKLKQETTSGSISENESTTISGTITAENGKEKTATVGNTTITSNGANISFTTTTSKAIYQAFETKYQEQQSQILEQSQTISLLESQLTSLKSEFANFRSTYESEKEAESKKVKKTGFTAPVWIIVAVVVILILFVWYFRKPAFLYK